MKRALLLLLLCGCILVSQSGHATARVTSVAVVDFYNVTQDTKWHWLGKGLADMLITDLSVSDRLQIVDREALQAYRRELALPQSGLVDPVSVLPLGQVARVGKLLFGIFVVDHAAQVRIQVSLVDVASQQVEQVVNVQGSVQDILQLADTLAFKLLRNLGVTLGPEAMEQIHHRWTDSLDATAHFYTALDHYDRGAAELALAEARVATKIDVLYLPAHYWVGRLFMELGEYRHAEIAWRHLLASTTNASYVMHASLLFAQLYAKYLEAPEQGIPLLEALTRPELDAIERANVDFRLAQLYMATKRYNDAYILFLALHRTQNTPPLREQFALPYKSVNLLSMREIKRAAVERYQTAFLQAYYHSDTRPEPAAEMVLLSPAQSTYGRTETLQRYFSYPSGTPKPLFYVPRGLRFKAFTLEYRGKQTQVSIHPQVYHTEDFALIGQKANLPAPVDGIAARRYDTGQEMTQAVLFNAYISGESADAFSWKITAEFLPENAPQPGSVAYWSRVMDRNTTHPIVLDTPGHLGGEVSLLEDRHGAMWAIYDTNVDIDEHGKDSDLWLFHTQDTQLWQGPKRLSALNSTANDMSPTLVQDDRNRYVLVFVSNRRGTDDLWLSLSLNGITWQRPRRLRLTTDDGQDITALASPTLFQDSRGIYRLGFYHRSSENLLLTSSRDLVHWETPFTPAADVEDFPRRDVDFDYFEDKTGVFRLIASGSFVFDLPMVLGSSYDARTWTFTKAPFAGNSHPAVIYDDAGRFALIFSSNGKGFYYLHQTSSSDWHTWSTGELLPRLHYFVDTHMARADILQDSAGYYWIAVHKNYGHKFQLFRLRSFPVTTMGETYRVRADAHYYARYQLRREEEILRASRAERTTLASCLRRARRFEVCFRNR